MEENQIQQSNKREQYELKRQQKLEEQVQAVRKKTVKKISKIVLIVLLAAGSVGWLTWYIVNQPKTPESEIISQSGIHWHPELIILIKGQKQEISANIGMGIAEKPIHTHDDMGVIHLEFSGLVKKDDIRLGKFFEIWGKKFNKDCIFDQCSGAEGKLKMLVNGKENFDFENYIMRDGDKIKIVFE